MNTDQPQNQPLRSRVSRRRLLLSAAGGVGALATAGGTAWWVRHDTVRGPRIWSTAPPGGRVALPADPQENLYVSGYDGNVSALDPRTGAVRWSRTLGTPDAVDSYGGWPLAVGDAVVCVTTPTRVQVLTAATGQVRWELPMPDWRDFAWQQTPAVGGGGVLTPDGVSLRCHDAADGGLRWTSRAGISGVPVVAGDSVFVPGRPAGFLALDAQTGERRWEQNAVRTVRGDSGPVVHRGVVHLADSDPAMANPAVLALDSATGRVLWRRSQPRGLTCPPAVSEGTVCLLSGNRLTALEAETGETRWTTVTANGLGRGQSSMTTGDGAAYVGTNDDCLYAFDLATGRLRWQDEPEHRPPGTSYAHVSLAATGTTVYRGSRTGVHALGTLPSV
ncbi:PQQ-binding-like beta-propeller repeat protein [Kitasatospora sp. NPDC059327]|uniref:outer membrane protein assembly factor BamB family protein n=1 Tax=Kitasatospora sp. NPDC059327 TaxID=3346803 RepID=UPI0036903125